MDLLLPTLDALLPGRLRARIWNSAATRAFAATAHDGYELAWVHRAGLLYTVDGTRVALQPGQVMLVPPGASHASTFSAGMHASAVHVDTALVEGLAAALGTAPPQRARVLDNAAHIAQLGDLLVRETAGSGADARLCAAALVDAVVLQALRTHAPHAVAEVPRADARLATARDFIHAHAGDAISVDDIAAAAGMSRFHFSRAFTAQFGTPPHQYLRGVRLLESARLLRLGHSVTDAALGAGITDLARFAQLFRARFGVAPSVYASERRNDNTDRRRPPIAPRESFPSR